MAAAVDRPWKCSSDAGRAVGQTACHASAEKSSSRAGRHVSLSRCSGSLIPVALECEYTELREIVCEIVFDRVVDRVGGLMDLRLGQLLAPVQLVTTED